MIPAFKRYGMALVFLFLVIVLMILGTWGVKTFGEKMLEETPVTMHPRGESLNP